MHFHYLLPNKHLSIYFFLSHVLICYNVTVECISIVCHTSLCFLQILSTYAIILLTSLIFIKKICSITFQETLHKHKHIDKEEQAARYSNIRLSDLEESSEQDSSTKGKKLFKNWPLMSSIIHYCIISFDDAAYSEVF